jgi:cyanophycinase-like exopeptidase
MSRVMIYGGNPIATTREGLGLLEGCVIDQHFTERQREARLHGVVHRYPSWIGIGIDERTAIVVRGTQIEVVGDRAAHVFVAHRGRTPVTLTEGDAYDLLLRRRMESEPVANGSGMIGDGMLTP